MHLIDVHTQTYTYKNVVPHSYHPRLLSCMIMDPQSILSTYILPSFRDLKININVKKRTVQLHFLKHCTDFIFQRFTKPSKHAAQL